MKKALIPSLFLFISLSGALAQEVIQKEYHTVATGLKITDLSWMVGFWKGPGLNGDCEELWMPAQDNSMTGIFRYSENEKLIFTEYMAIKEEEGKIYLKVKHFSADFSPWEEKDKWINFPLIKLEKQTAYFDNLTIYRSGDQMTIKLTMEHNGESSIVTFEYQKVEL